MLIPSKLVCSFRLQNSIPRKRLIQELDKSCSYPVVLINAPAGYGKTTLVSQWIENKKNIGWYALDEGDNNSDRFATYFSAALHSAINEEIDVLLEENRKANLLALFNQLLIKAAAFSEHFYLAIDDYHIIENDEIHEALKYWIKHQPSNMTLILISRSIPPLSIASLRVQEQLLEIDINQLMFDHQESTAFFQARLGSELNQQDVIALCNEVEGWPTALQLISLFAKNKSHTLQVPLQDIAKRLAKSNHFHINEYLADEVLNKVDEETRLFILRCSVLHSMNESLVQAVTGEQNSRTKLESLEKQGLFLQQMANSKWQSSDDSWWKFHPLFASFLNLCCQNELYAELPQLHQKAANAWLQLGYVTEALHHAMQLSDTGLLLNILSKHAWTVFHQGELKLLEESLNCLDYAHLTEHTNLVLLKAWLVQSQHRHIEVGGILADFSRALTENKIELSKTANAEFNVLRAQVAINSGDENTALQLASEALNDLSENAYYAHIVATSIIGEAHHCHGNLAEALAMLQKAERMARQHHTYHNILWSQLQQSEILLAQGFSQAAYEMLDKASEFVKENHLQKVPMYEFLLRSKGKILWEWYNLDKAESMAVAGMNALSKFEDKLQCLTLLTKISLARGNLDNTARLLGEVEQLEHSHSYHHDWIANADQVRIFYWQMTNDVSAVRNWLIQNPSPVSDKNHFTQVQWRNIARSRILLEEYHEAKAILDNLIETAEKFSLISDLNRALIVRNRLYFLQGEKELAQQDLIQALKLTRQTNFISAFVIEGDVMAQQIRHLLQLNVLDELVLHKAQFILRNINQFYRQKFAHFDENFVNQLLKNPKVPELLKISPLTQREWQVLGLIYSGYSNEQISDELQVAATTIKTHIRNLYQKIGVTNRNEAISYTKELLMLMGYH
ncbi:TPA: HTH-type transcriptional regulator MalT [Mannheimia haemolytica]|uniref:HTH-type transcriptional regulator MalT n=1 Tax=Mannheimia haemolytica TaxID=75985 RepID=A0A547ET43_MANHA|nr:HTH-type transcriptional regulator MalT [Mannheimia haemolytica]AWW70857.1 HTH-type transcriptional regulator MalT [Pasteurellaceae bacterium 12565]AGI31948.2 HTH-type transcriptional regulator MalT [Mannheimia haemolytica USDA-ARS-USMARC-183]AGI35942.2 HTH-type transcriptional regulator MalT [Mannheimia haemolytica USDA-ARS-USMARC-185]AGK03220.1 HTH-type transcriptional activator MalT [Mannheimia haemolytica M42548]AGQ25295.1 transcriptional regulator [Mannheimia haemolytica D153]